MLTKFNSSNDMNTIASDAISSYINDGYRIDAKESVIDRNKDKDCTFKAVLKKDVDGIELKTTITITDNGDDKNKSCTYHKVETAGGLKWSEETRTFSHSTDQIKLNSQAKNNTVDDLRSTRSQLLEHEDDSLYDYYNDAVSRIFKDFGLHGDLFGDELGSRRKHIDDVTKTDSDDKKPSYGKSSECKKCTKCKSAYQRLDDYIKHITDDKDKHSSDEKEHIKVDAKDSESDIYNKIVNRKKNLEDACNTKANNVDAKEEDLQKQDASDDIEDSLVKLVRWIFGH